DDTVVTFGAAEAPAADETIVRKAPAADETVVTEPPAADETIVRTPGGRRGKAAAAQAPTPTAEVVPMPAPPRPSSPAAISFPREETPAVDTRIAAASATAGQVTATTRAQPGRTRELVQFFLLALVFAIAAFAATNFLVGFAQNDSGSFSIAMWATIVCVVGMVLVAVLALTNRSSR
ncbi:MAG: hypothetical protein WAT58_07415, partial [Candidatus Dormiibacterota bacterium]